MTNEEYTQLNEILDRIEAKMDEMDKKLDIMVGEIDKYYQYNRSRAKTVTSTYDGEIMFRYKNSNDNGDEK